MKVRAAALKRVGEGNIREGEPLATLEDRLVPIYMLHRYQAEAASKLVGGMDYTFALRGDGEVATQMVAPAEQRRALAALLETVKPEALELPEALLEIIPPRPPMYPRDREMFKIHTSPAFDAVAPAEAAAQQVLQFLFSPERAARLVEFHARDKANLGLDEVLDAVMNATWRAKHTEGYEEVVHNAVDDVVLYDLMALAGSEKTSWAVREIAWKELGRLKELAGASDAKSSLERAHAAFALREIELFEKDPKKIDLGAPVESPDGPPIGDQGWMWCEWE